MADHNDLGKEAEEKAGKFLQLSGYEILERNWRYLKAEIDIIAKKGNVLAVIEVKGRSRGDITAPEEAVTHSKKKLLLMAANHYAEETDREEEIRFDIISMLKNGKEWEITHIEDAFNALL